MSRIVFHESYIIVMPTYNKAASHKHPAMHLFYSKKGCKIMVDQKEIRGNVILLKSDVRHAVDESSDCDFFLLIEPTGTIAEQLSNKYLIDHNDYSISENMDDIISNINYLSDEDLIKRINHLLLHLGISVEHTAAKDERIRQVISKIISGEWMNNHVSEIADNVFLSESRLAHLFKEEVGISLKSYLLIRRMEHAYKIVNSGGNITKAAMESGFASSSHLAYTCKTLTGISITDVLAGSKRQQIFERKA